MVPFMALRRMPPPRNNRRGTSTVNQPTNKQTKQQRTRQNGGAQMWRHRHQSQARQTQHSRAHPAQHNHRQLFKLNIHKTQRTCDRCDTCDRRTDMRPRVTRGPPSVVPAPVLAPQRGPSTTRRRAPGRSPATGRRRPRSTPRRCRPPKRCATRRRACPGSPRRGGVGLVPKKRTPEQDSNLMGGDGLDFPSQGPHPRGGGPAGSCLLGYAWKIRRDQSNFRRSPNYAKPLQNRSKKRP